jgi:hypothetical protein
MFYGLGRAGLELRHDLVIVVRRDAGPQPHSHTSTHMQQDLKSTTLIVNRLADKIVQARAQKTHYTRRKGMKATEGTIIKQGWAHCPLPSFAAIQIANSRAHVLRGKSGSMLWSAP